MKSEVGGGARARAGAVERETRETRISLKVALNGSGRGRISTGLGFFDHMLDLFARHGHIDLDVDASGDLETGAHHLVEDVGIVLGQAIDEALGDRAGIARYGSALIPMDGSLALCAIDLSGRPHFRLEGEIPRLVIAGFETELVPEFLRALAFNARLTVHLHLLANDGVHHVVEASFKALARALRAAVAIDPQETGVPSTKGVL